MHPTNQRTAREQVVASLPLGPQFPTLPHHQPHSCRSTSSARTVTAKTLRYMELLQCTVKATPWRKSSIVAGEFVARCSHENLVPTCVREKSVSLSTGWRGRAQHWPLPLHRVYNDCNCDIVLQLRAEQTWSESIKPQHTIFSKLTELIFLIFLQQIHL